MRAVCDGWRFTGVAVTLGVALAGVCGAALAAQTPGVGGPVATAAGAGAAPAATATRGRGSNRACSGTHRVHRSVEYPYAAR